MMAATPVVRYKLDDDTEVRFEVSPSEGFRPAGPDHLVGQLEAAVAPAVAGARAVLDEVKKIAPQEIELTFGLKVSGTMNWLVAKAATEGNFQVTLTWKPGGG
jgi:hypothetical protein